MLIGLIGKSKSGKDEVAKILVNDFNFVRLSFADIFKKELSNILNIDIQTLNDNKDKILSLNNNDGILSKFDMRDVIINFGMLIRNVDSNYMINKVIDQIDQSKNVVITDVRFEDEVDIVNNMNGTTIKIVRDVDNKINHITENISDVYDADYIINNNVTIKQLKNVVIDILNKIGI